MAAFAQLLEERPMNKITVKDIVDRCDVNRNTFYYHFQDIPSLLREMMETQVDGIIREHCALGRPTGRRCSTCIGPCPGSCLSSIWTGWPSGWWTSILTTP